jgi:hypothetical protein
MFLTVFPSKYRVDEWCYSVDGVFSKGSFDTIEKAKLELFEAYWEVLQLDD